MVTFTKKGRSAVGQGKYYKGHTELAFNEVGFSLRVGDLLTDFEYDELDMIQATLDERGLKLIVVCEREGVLPNAAVIGRCVHE
jgi:hypothetical protein